MFKYSLTETKQPPRCQRCGGQVIRFPDEIGCLQCGAPHTEDGKLATYSARKLGLHLPRRRRRRTFGGYNKAKSAVR